jgi:ABC-type transport system substrate-binding protein
MKLVVVLAAALTLCACGGASQAPERAAAAPDAQPSASAPDLQPSASAPKRETVFDPLVGTLDRAKGVQQTIDDQAAAQRRQIDEAAR